ncbi:hypothetical protein [Glaciimonas soli]|nr:hypothetical protein [Glaciimonas soli]
MHTKRNTTATQHYTPYDFIGHQFALPGARHPKPATRNTGLVAIIKRWFA